MYARSAATTGLAFSSAVVADASAGLATRSVRGSRSSTGVASPSSARTSPTTGPAARTTGGYYDANGHYVRISVQGNPVTAQGAGSALNPPGADLAGQYFFRRGVLSRCPGAATQAHPDGSNPWRAGEAPCKREDDTP